MCAPFVSLRSFRAFSFHDSPYFLVHIRPLLLFLQSSQDMILLISLPAPLSSRSPSRYSRFHVSVEVEARDTKRLGVMETG